MKTTTKELAQVMRTIILGSDDKLSTVNMIAAYLVSERRTKDLPVLMRELERLQIEKDGVMEVVATSAFPLSSAMKQELESLFPAQSVKLVERQDKSLIGGVTVSTLDHKADFSIRSKLQKLTSNRT